jgi:peptidyl-prolyl cis-trans isomerase C
MKIKHRKKFLGIVTVLIFMSVILPALAKKRKPVKDKVAVVNGTVITQAEFDKEIEGYVQQHLAQTGKRLNNAQLLKTKKDVLESLINNELLYQESKKKRIKIDKKAINNQLDRIKKNFSEKGAFEKRLDEMNLTEKDLKFQIKRGLAVQQFINQEFIQKIIVSEKEGKLYYDRNPNYFKQPEQVRASHILIKVDPLSDESKKKAVRKKLEKIKKRLEKGEDFAALAKEFSDCPSKKYGGDLYYFTRGKMAKPFEKAAFSLKKEKISDIVETKFGYHLIKVTDKKSATIVAYEEIKDKIKRYIKRNKVEKEINLYVTKLKEKSKIKRFLEIDKKVHSPKS